MLTTGESKSSVYRCFILVCFNFSADVKFFKWKLGIKNGKKKKVSLKKMPYISLRILL